MAGTSHLSIVLPPMAPLTQPLSDRFVRDLSRVKGAPEHEQIVRIMVDAKGYRLDDIAAAELSRLLQTQPITIERNLDTIRIPSEAIWIEYPDAPRRDVKTRPLAGALHPVNVGALVCPDEHDPNRVVVVTAWDFPDGSTRHSYAVAALDLERLSQHAWLARNRFSTDPKESVSRLLDLIEISIPPGLAQELQVIEELEDPEGWQERYIEHARGAAIDVSAEVPYVLAALIALETEQVRTRSLGEGRPQMVQASPRRGLRIPFLPRSHGFRRLGAKATPKVEWMLSASA